MPGKYAALWMNVTVELIKQDLPVFDRFHMNTADSVLDELLEKVEDFTRGWMINGLKPDEYEEFGPVVLFRESFGKAWSGSIEIIKQRRS